MSQRRDWKALAIPRNCAQCPISRTAVCRPFVPHALHIPEALKRGDRVIGAGHALLTQGQPCTELYHLLDGWAAVCDYTSSGTRRILDILLPGAFIGYQRSTGAPAAYTVEALTPCSFCIFPRQRFDAAVGQYGELGQAVLDTMTAQRDRLQCRLSELARHNAQSRLALFLLDLYERAVHSAPAYVSGTRRTIPLTHDEMADATFMTRIHLNRHLHTLTHLGVLAYRGREFDFLDLPGLRVIAEGRARPAA